MNVPKKIPGLRWLTAVTGLYAVIWIGLEGSLWRATLLAVGLTAVSLLYLLQKYLGGKTLSPGGWLSVTAVMGLLFGSGSSLLTLILTAVKTGLHAHGPEFSPAEISWVLQQMPLWTAVGLLVGLGLGMIGLGRQK